MLGVACAQGDRDDAAELVGDDALTSDGLAFPADVADDVFLAGLGCVAHDGVGDLFVVEDSVALAVEGAHEGEGGGAIAEEDEAALGAGETEGVLNHGAENVFEHASVVEALCGLQEESELLELGTSVAGRDLVKECAGGAMVLFGDEEEADAGCAKFYAVAGMEAGGVRVEVVDEGTVTTAEILKEKPLRILVNDGVLARDLRVGEIEVRVRLTANCEGQGVDGYGSRLVRFTNYQTSCMFGFHNRHGSAAG
jgi:hypothetical protein